MVRLPSDQVNRLSDIDSMYKYPPKVRSDCLGAARPCPWVRCKYHMVWALAFPQNMTDEQIVDKIFEMSETCVLDVADYDGVILQELADIFGVTRERIRQLENFNYMGGYPPRAGAIQKLRKGYRRAMLADFVGD